MEIKTFEDFLKDKHAEYYSGTDDAMPDSFESFLLELDVDSWLKYGDEYAHPKCPICKGTGVVEIMGGSDKEEWGVIDTKPCDCK